MNSRKEKNVLWLATGVFFGVYLINLIFIIKSSPLILPFKDILVIVLKYSSIFVIVGYAAYVSVFLWLVDIYRLSVKLKSLIQTMSLAGIFVIVAWLFFTFLERINYSNYVFSTYDIFLPSLQRFANFQVVVLISGYYVYWYLKKRKRDIRKYLFSVVIVVLFVNIFLGNYTRIIDIILNETKFVVLYKQSGGKIEKTPDFVALRRWSNFIVNYTEENSTVIHPKQSEEYPVVGNQPLIRYFLYPRVLVSTTFADEYLSDSNKKNIYFLFKRAYDKPGEYFPSEERDFVKIYIMFLDGTVSEYSKSDFEENFDKIYENLDIGVLKIR